VTLPEIFAVPTTESVDVGLGEPIPRFPET